jgi:hypothetical protein
MHLEALLQSRCDGSEVAVNLGWRATQDKGNNGGASHVNVLESCAISSVLTSEEEFSRYNVPPRM